MRDPESLITWHAEPEPVPGGRTLVYAFSGFLDAANAAATACRLLLGREPRLLATIDVDEVLDYRSRRPRMTFVRDHFAAVDLPQVALHEVVDEAGVAFLVLSGPEPDFQWQRFAAAVVSIVERTGVDLCVGIAGIPWPAPHTRPVGLTVHGNDPRLLAGEASTLGTLEVPGHIGGLLELALGEAGHRAVGLAAHVPHYLAQFDYPRAAIALLDGLSRVAGLTLSGTDLAAAADLSDAEVDRQVAGSDEFAAVLAALEQQYDEVVALRAAGAGAAAHDLAPGGQVPSGEQIAAQVERFLSGLADDERSGEHAAEFGDDDRPSA